MWYHFDLTEKSIFNDLSKYKTNFNSVLSLYITTNSNIALSEMVLTYFFSLKVIILLIFVEIFVLVLVNVTSNKIYIFIKLKPKNFKNH